ncbi:hypothetical protein TNCV_1916831 [Trichonephila clavipes]|uniref:Uncharacterized protein n=1 Tax=Trichonephila clavipes TaxID=2585209 RepID=A0A8X6W0K9_TRICX|nr:hypothetical protein TNCV_1916831 [Trichonephila clavipes]
MYPCSSLLVHGVQLSALPPKNTSVQLLRRGTKTEERSKSQEWWRRLRASRQLARRPFKFPGTFITPSTTKYHTGAYVERRLDDVGLNRRPFRRLPQTPHHGPCPLGFCRPRQAGMGLTEGVCSIPREIPIQSQC